jgi:outer membrane lipoprotein-sorting protein
MNRKLAVFFVVLSSLLLSGCLLEDKIGTVGVNVISSAGGDLEGAEVVIKTKTSTVVAEGITGNDGRWETDVPVGDYTIEISKEGYSNTCLEDKTIGAGRIVINCTLIPEQSEESIQEILAKAENIENIEFVLPSLRTGESGFGSKIFVKGEKFRMENYLPGTSIIFDGIKQYAFDQHTGLCTDTDLIETPSRIPKQEHPLKYFKDLITQAKNASDLTEKGKEKINGLNTRIITFTDQKNTSENKTVKLWVSEDYGIPVKMNVGSLTVELTDIKVNSVQDSVFECNSIK